MIRKDFKNYKKDEKTIKNKPKADYIVIEMN
jgi:hypothetical protein